MTDENIIDYVEMLKENDIIAPAEKTAPDYISEMSYREWPNFFQTRDVDKGLWKNYVQIGTIGPICLLKHVTKTDSIVAAISGIVPKLWYKIETIAEINKLFSVYGVKNPEDGEIFEPVRISAYLGSIDEIMIDFNTLVQYILINPFVKKYIWTGDIDTNPWPTDISSIEYAQKLGKMFEDDKSIIRLRSLYSNTYITFSLRDPFR